MEIGYFYPTQLLPTKTRKAKQKINKKVTTFQTNPLNFNQLLSYFPWHRISLCDKVTRVSFLFSFLPPPPSLGNIEQWMSNTWVLSRPGQCLLESVHNSNIKHSIFAWVASKWTDKRGNVCTCFLHTCFRNHLNIYHRTAVKDQSVLYSAMRFC